MELDKILKSDLWDEDKQLFSNILDKYISNAEKTFFETLCDKMLYENAPCKELLLNPDDNEDSIYIYRIGDEEMEVGSSANGARLHSMTLDGILNANLLHVGCLDNDISLWQWLRNRDYAGIRYDQNLENKD